MSSSDSSSDNIRLNVSQLRKYLGTCGTRKKNGSSPSASYGSASSSQRGGNGSRGDDKRDTTSRASRMASSRSTAEAGSIRLSAGLSARGDWTSQDKLSPRLRRLASESLRARSSSSSDDDDGDNGGLRLSSTLLSKALQQRKALVSQANSAASSSNTVTRSPEVPSSVSQRMRNDQSAESNTRRRQSIAASDRQQASRSQSSSSAAAGEFPPLPLRSLLSVKPQVIQHTRSFGSQRALSMGRHSLIQHRDTHESDIWTSPQETPRSKTNSSVHSTATITRGNIKTSIHMVQHHDAPDSPSHAVSGRRSLWLPRPPLGEASRSSNSSASASVDAQAQPEQSELAAREYMSNWDIHPAVAPTEDVIVQPHQPRTDVVVDGFGVELSKLQQQIAVASRSLPTSEAERVEANWTTQALRLEGQASSDRDGAVAAVSTGQPGQQRLELACPGIYIGGLSGAPDEHGRRYMAVDRKLDDFISGSGQLEGPLAARRQQTSVEGVVRAVLGVPERAVDDSPPRSPSMPAAHSLQPEQNGVPNGMPHQRHTLATSGDAQRELPKSKILTVSPVRPQDSCERSLSPRLRLGVSAVPTVLPVYRARSEGGGFDSIVRGLKSQREYAAMALPLMPAPNWNSLGKRDGMSPLRRKIMTSAGSSPRDSSPRGSSRQPGLAKLSSTTAKVGSRLSKPSSPVAPAGVPASRVACDSSSSDGGSVPSFDCAVPSLSLREARVNGPNTLGANTSASTLELPMSSFSFPVPEGRLHQTSQSPKAGAPSRAWTFTKEAAGSPTRSPARSSDPKQDILSSPASRADHILQAQCIHQRGRVMVPHLEIPVTDWSRLQAGPMLAAVSAPASPTLSPPRYTARCGAAATRTSMERLRCGSSPAHLPERGTDSGQHSSDERKQAQPTVIDISNSGGSVAGRRRSRSPSPPSKTACPTTVAAAITAAGAVLLKRLARSPSAATRRGFAKAPVSSQPAATSVVSPPKSPAASLVSKGEASSGGSTGGAARAVYTSPPSSPRSPMLPSVTDMVNQSKICVASPRLQLSADTNVAASSLTATDREGRCIQCCTQMSPALISSEAAGSTRDKQAHMKLLSSPERRPPTVSQQLSLLSQGRGVRSSQEDRRSPANMVSSLSQRPNANNQFISSPQHIFWDAVISPRISSSGGRGGGRRYASSPSSSRFVLEALRRSSPKEPGSGAISGSSNRPVLVPTDLPEREGISQQLDDLLRNADSIGSSAAGDGLRLMTSLSSTHTLSPLVRDALRSVSSIQLDGAPWEALRSTSIRSASSTQLDGADADILRQLADAQRDMARAMHMVEPAAPQPMEPLLGPFGSDTTAESRQDAVTGGDWARHGFTNFSQPSSCSSITKAAATSASIALAQTLAALERATRMEAAAANVRAARARVGSPPSTAMSTTVEASSSAILHRARAATNISPPKPVVAAAVAQPGSGLASGLQTPVVAVSKPLSRIEPLALQRTSPSSPRTHQHNAPWPLSASPAASAVVKFARLGTTGAFVQEHMFGDAGGRSRSTPHSVGHTRRGGRYSPYGFSGDSTRSPGAGSGGGAVLRGADGTRSRSVSAGGRPSPHGPANLHLPFEAGAIGRVNGGGGTSPAAGNSPAAARHALGHYSQFGVAASAAGGGTAGVRGQRLLSALDLSQVKRGLSHVASQAQQTGHYSPLRGTTVPTSAANLRGLHDSPAISPFPSPPVVRTLWASPGAAATPKVSASNFMTGFMPGGTLGCGPPATEKTSPHSLSPGSNHAVSQLASPRAASRLVSPMPAYSVLLTTFPSHAGSPRDRAPDWSSSPRTAAAPHRPATPLGTQIMNTAVASSSAAEPIARAAPGVAAPWGLSPLHGDASAARPHAQTSSGAGPGSMTAGRRQSSPRQDLPLSRALTGPTSALSQAQVQAMKSLPAQPGARPSSMTTAVLTSGPGSPKGTGGGRSPGLDMLLQSLSIGPSTAAGTCIGTAAIPAPSTVAAGALGVRANMEVSPRLQLHAAAMATAPAWPTLSGLSSSTQSSQVAAATGSLLAGGTAAAVTAGDAPGYRRALLRLTTADVLPYNNEQGTKRLSPTTGSNSVAWSAAASATQSTQAGHQRLLAQASVVGPGDEATLARVPEAQRGRMHYPDANLLRILQQLRSAKVSKSRSVAGGGGSRDNAGGSSAGADGGGGSGLIRSAWCAGSGNGGCRSASIACAREGVGPSPLHNCGSGSSRAFNAAHASRSGRAGGGHRYGRCSQSYDCGLVNTEYNKGVRPPRLYDVSEHARRNPKAILQWQQHSKQRPLDMGLPCKLPAAALKSVGTVNIGRVVGPGNGSGTSAASSSLPDQSEDSATGLTEYSFAPGLESSLGTLCHTPPAADSLSFEASGSDSDDSRCQKGIRRALRIKTDRAAVGGVMDADSNACLNVFGLAGNENRCSDGGSCGATGLNRLNPENRPLTTRSSLSVIEDASAEDGSRGPSSIRPDESRNGDAEELQGYVAPNVNVVPGDSLVVHQWQEDTAVEPSRRANAALQTDSLAGTDVLATAVAEAVETVYMMPLALTNPLDSVAEFGPGSSSLDAVLVSCDVTILSPGPSVAASLKTSREVRSARDVDSRFTSAQKGDAAAAITELREEVGEVEEAPVAEESSAGSQAEVELRVPPLLGKVPCEAATMVSRDFATNAANIKSLSGVGESAEGLLAKQLCGSSNLANFKAKDPHDQLVDEQPCISTLPQLTAPSAVAASVALLTQPAIAARPPALAAPVSWDEMDANQVLLANDGEDSAKGSGRMSLGRPSRKKRMASASEAMAHRFRSLGADADSSSVVAAATAELLLPAREANRVMRSTAWFGRGNNNGSQPKDTRPNPCTTGNRTAVAADGTEAEEVIIRCVDGDERNEPESASGARDLSIRCPLTQTDARDVPLPAAISSDSPRKHMETWSCTPEPAAALPNEQRLSSSWRQPQSPDHSGLENVPMNAVLCTTPDSSAMCRNVSSKEILDYASFGFAHATAVDAVPPRTCTCGRGGSCGCGDGRDGSGPCRDREEGFGGRRSLRDLDYGYDHGISRDGDSDSPSPGRLHDVGNDGVQGSHPARSLEANRRPFTVETDPRLGAGPKSNTRCRPESPIGPLLSHLGLLDQHQQGPEASDRVAASEIHFNPLMDTDSLPSGTSSASTGQRSGSHGDDGTPSRQSGVEKPEGDPEPEPDISPDLAHTHKRRPPREAGAYRRVDLIAADITFDGYLDPGTSTITVASSTQAAHSQNGPAVSTASATATVEAEVINPELQSAVCSGRAARFPGLNSGRAALVTTVSPAAPSQQHNSQVAVALAREVDNVNGSAVSSHIARPLTGLSTIYGRPEALLHQQSAPVQDAAPIPAPASSPTWTAPVLPRVLLGVTQSDNKDVALTAAAFTATPSSAAQASVSAGRRSDGADIQSGTRLFSGAAALLRYAAVQDSSESSPRRWDHRCGEETVDSPADNSSPAYTLLSASPSSTPSEKDVREERRPLSRARPPDERGTSVQLVSKGCVAVRGEQAATDDTASKTARASTDAAITATIVGANAATSSAPNSAVIRNRAPSFLTTIPAASASGAASIHRINTSDTNSMATILVGPKDQVAAPTSLATIHELRIASTSLSPPPRKQAQHRPAGVLIHPSHPQGSYHELEIHAEGDVCTTQAAPFSASSQPGKLTCKEVARQHAAGGEAQSPAPLRVLRDDSSLFQSQVAMSPQLHQQSGRTVNSDVQQESMLLSKQGQQQQSQQGALIKILPHHGVAMLNHCRPAAVLAHAIVSPSRTDPSLADAILDTPLYVDDCVASPAPRVVKATAAISPAAIIRPPRLSFTLVGPLAPVGDAHGLVGTASLDLAGGQTGPLFTAGNRNGPYTDRLVHDVSIGLQSHANRGLKRSSLLEQYPPIQGQRQGLQLQHGPAWVGKDCGSCHSYQRIAQSVNGFQKGLEGSGWMDGGKLGKQDTFQGGKVGIGHGTCRPQTTGSGVGRQASVSVHGVLAAAAAPAGFALTQTPVSVSMPARSKITAAALMPPSQQPQPVMQRHASSVLVASLRQLNCATQSVCARMLELYYNEAGMS